MRMIQSAAHLLQARLMIVSLFVLISISSGSVAFGAGSYQLVNPPPFSLAPIATGLDQPGNVVVVPGDTNRMFVSERLGAIRVIRNDSLLPIPFLDLSAKIQTYSTQIEGPTRSRNGLMDIAFPPDYADSGYFLVMYLTVPDTALVIERYRVSSQSDSADPLSGELVLSLPLTGKLGSVTSFSDECSMIFGKDSLLYLAVADYSSSAGGVNFDNQGPNTLFGHLVRIDVRSLPYSVPSGNPYVSSPDTLPEILSIEPISACRSMSLDPFNGDIHFTSDQTFQWWSPCVYHLLPAGSVTVETPFVAVNVVQWPSLPSAGAVMYRGNSIPWLNGRFLHAVPQSTLANSIPDVFGNVGAFTTPGTFFSITLNSGSKIYSEHPLNIGGLFNDPSGEVVTIIDSTIFRLVPAVCCLGTRGNVDCNLDDGVDIADLTLFVDHLFGSFPPLCCPEEGNVDGIGEIDIADLTRLVDHLFISFGPTASCP